MSLLEKSGSIYAINFVVVLVVVFLSNSLVNSNINKAKSELVVLGKDTEQLLLAIDERVATLENAVNRNKVIANDKSIVNVPTGMAASSAIVSGMVSGGELSGSEQQHETRTPKELENISRLDAYLVNLENEALSPEDVETFRNLVTSGNLLEKYIPLVQESVDKNPSIENRMLLADMYSDKAWKSGGREAGIFAKEAEDLRMQILEDDPYHWQARYNLALNYSMYPSFLNKGPDAIRHFEYLKEMQKTLTVADGFADTYLQLANTYRKQGNVEMARKTLMEGAEQYPDDRDIKDQIDTMLKSK